MKAYIKERTLQIARYVASTHETVRQTANVFNLSKSTVHHDLSKRLPKVDNQMYEEVKSVLDENFSEKHLRGGEATKKKYEEQNKIKN